MRREKGSLTDVGHSLWGHMKYAQHAAHNPKFEKDRLKGATHMIEGGHLLNKSAKGAAEYLTQAEVIR